MTAELGCQQYEMNAALQADELNHETALVRLNMCLVAWRHAIKACSRPDTADVLCWSELWRGCDRKLGTETCHICSLGLVGIQVASSLCRGSHTCD